MEGITFFGEVDINKKGQIASEYPAWYFDNHIEEMKETIATRERALERNAVPPPEIPLFKEKLKAEKERLEKIVSSKPKLTAKQKDELAKEYKHLKKEIRDSMFTRSEMKLGIASPHEEARRMVEASIPINPVLAEKMGVPVRGGKISRKGAEKIAKIISRQLGENTNIEAWRRDKATVRTGMVG